MAYTIEQQVRLYDDKSGEFISIGPDADGLDLIDIRAYDRNEKSQAVITVTAESAKLLAEAITKYLEITK